MAAIDAACEHGARLQRDANEGQAQLFGAFGDDGRRPRRRRGRRRLPLPEATPWTETEQLGVREGDARPVLERPSGRSLRGGAEGVRRAVDGELAEAPADARRATTRGGPAAASRSKPDTSVGGIVAACRQLKTRKGDRMAVFTLEDAQGGVEVIAFPEAYQRARGADRDRHAGAGARQARARRRVGAGAGVGDRAARQRARAAGARGGDPRHACRPTAAMFEALGEIFSRHRGDRRVSFEIELPASRRAGCGCGRTCRSQIRVQPSSALDRRSRADRRSGAALGDRCELDGRLGACHALKRSTSKSRSPSLLKEIEALDAAAAHRRARSRDRVAAAARSRRCARELYASLTPWQRVLVARHPEPARPRGLHPAAVHRTSSRSTATAASPTTTRS